MVLPTTRHFWDIHKIVMTKALKGLNQREYDAVTHDQDSPEFRGIQKFVACESIRIYEDESHSLNDPSKWRDDPINCPSRLKKIKKTS